MCRSLSGVRYTGIGFLFLIVSSFHSLFSMISASGGMPALFLCSEHSQWNPLWTMLRWHNFYKPQKTQEGKGGAGNVVTSISQEDVWLAESFWEDCGKELLIRLSINNVPFYQLSAQSPYAANEVSSICKYVYRNKRGEHRARWLTNHPKKGISGKNLCI